MPIATVPRSSAVLAALTLLVLAPRPSDAQPPVRAVGARGGVLPRRAADDSLAADSARSAVAGRATADSGTRTVAARAAAAPVAPDSRPREEALPEMETDRPDFTEVAALVPVGHVQLESGETFSREGGQSSITIGESLFRIGVARRLELRVATNSYTMQSNGIAFDGGFEDIALGVKVGLLLQPRGWVPQLSVIAMSTLPTGSSLYSTGRLHPTVKVVTAWDLAEGISLGSNLNWSRVDDDGDHDEYAASASVGFDLTERVGLYVEGFTFQAKLAGWERRDYLNGGFTFKVTPGLQLDVRAGVGPAPSQGDFFTGIGLSRRW